MRTTALYTTATPTGVACNDSKEDKGFSDNFEHLQSLEQEARLWLAIGCIKTGRCSEDSDAAGLKSICRLIDVSITADELNSASLQHRLHAVAKDNRSKALLSECKGVMLNFEHMCATYKLSEFERTVMLLLFSNYSSIHFRSLFNECNFERHESSDGEMRISTLLAVICNTFIEQLQNRYYFSIQSTLIRDELIVPTTYIGNSTNILDVSIIIHERIARHILGDKNTYDMSLQYIMRERPTLSIDQIVLPEKTKNDVLSLLQNFSCNAGLREQLCLRRFYGYGTGIVLMFCGPSGTGKTMFVQAIAASLGRELLSLNIGAIENSRTITFEDAVKHIFKEARLANAIVFFDECDDLLHENSRDSREFLIEIEKSECITILATNKAMELDPSFDRRITMKVQFEIPDAAAREQIWKTLVPEKVTIADDVNFKELARKYIFSGGLIKNALFMAINNSLQYCNNGRLTLSRAEIEKAALYQAETMFAPVEFCKTYVPEIAINDLSISERLKQDLYACARVAGTLWDRKTGVNVIIGTSDIKTGIECVDAIALEAGLNVKKFNFTDVILSTSAEKIQDPLTHRDISLFDYAFKTFTGCSAITLFVDPVSDFSRFVIHPDREAKERNMLDMMQKFRNFQGILIIVTSPLDRKNIPPEFHRYFEIGYPPREIQKKRWVAHLGSSFCLDEHSDMLLDKHPMHLQEIDFIMQQALIISGLQGKKDRITLQDIHDVIAHFKKRQSTPLLFGQNMIQENQKK